MKTRILLFVLAWVLFAPMAAAADQVKVVVEKVDLLRDNKPVATVKKGDVLDVVARRGAWVGVKLTRNGKSILGWIKKAQVEDIVQETPAEIWKRQMKEAEQKAHEQERRERQKYDELQKKEWTWRPIPNGQKPVAIVPKDWDGKAPLARQFGKIQSAINAAENGDEVVIRPGRYRENIDFKGKAITVRSINPADSKVVAGTIIDGNKKGSVVTFQSKEWLDSVLAGLTLTNGLGPMKKYGGEAKPSSSGGGVLCWQASPVLTHCVITRNEAVGGAGILVSSGSPYIGACTISDNDATRGRGGGIFASKGAHPRIHQSRILRNIADAGAGVFSHRSHVTITESMICRNVTNESLTAIMYYNWYQPIRVRNCVIAYNSARSGVSGVAAQGTYDRSPRTFTNCIFWQNGEDLFNCHAQYSCYQTKRIQRKHWKDQPVCLGNVLSAPYFVDPENDDYRLQPWSPCIGSGLGGVNMGAYPHQDVKKSPDTDSDKLPDAWELHHAPDLKALGAGDADKDGVTDLEEYRQGTHPLRDSMHMHVRAGADPKTADGSKEHPFPGVQAGLDAVADGGEVRIAAGTYRGGVAILVKSITLSGGWTQDFSSRRPFAPDDHTILRGGNPVLRIDGSNRPRVVGIGISGGRGPFAGGILCCPNTAPLFSECVIWGNNGGWGAGVSSRFANPVFRNCIIAHNRASKQTERTDNFARAGALGAVGDTLTLVNCTLVGNQAQTAGGVSVHWGCRARIVNCIFWNQKCRWGTDFEIGPRDKDGATKLVLHHSLISKKKQTARVRPGGIYEKGEGVLEGKDPLFADPKGPDGNPATVEDNDYRLMPGSPCIGTGDPEAAPPRDADGKPRMKLSAGGSRKGFCNMGAY